jgi:mono/diheme cytochrome c family protein
MRFGKLAKILAASVGLVCVAVFALVGYAAHASERTYAVPLPPIRADRTAAGVARGAGIFHATCEACHRPPNGERASGAPLHDAPDWFGTLHSGNVTSHPVAGIGGLSDGQVARMIRYGVNRAGKGSVMPHYGMSDADLAAVIGFLRSDDPLFRPDPRPAPRSALSLAAKAILFVSGSLAPPERPATGIVAPPRAASADYGRYLAEGVYMCGDCHTPGFAPDKSNGPDAYAGGMELKNAAGELIYAPNLSKDPDHGIGRWNRDQFARAVRDGIRPDGRALGYPMPHFRGADDIEVDALFAFLRSFPAKSAPVPGQQAALAAIPSAKPGAGDPEQLFTALGCSGCHGKGRLYEAKLANAERKPVADVARWIRNPERFLPGTAMPTFEAVLDEASALELATWIQRGGARGAGPSALH